ncbi:MAG: hypothetical protein CNC91_03195 [Flavobacteriales bacterium MED-G22]|nr:hypothetical protein [Flavobacteriaceae bacterium]PDH44030.1 MAG: hypothetical protein CNC91_03195 [Flavobacteriales bacterium MED-G22]
MKRTTLALILFFFISSFSNGQSYPTPDRLFYEIEPLELKLTFSSKEVKINTNDSTYVDIPLFVLDQKKWDTINVSLRARGNFRRSTCFFPPIRMEIKKKARKETLFEHYKKTKIVFPCLIEDEMNDNILKEFIAYKLFELVSPYHFRTRALKLNYTDSSEKLAKKFMLRGFLIEDDSRIAKRTQAKVYKKYIHPKSLDAEGAIKDAMFQYFLGNTDFSMAYQHNGKLVQVGESVIPIPYDFDMTGWVNPSYAVANTSLGLNSVEERVYRGYQREVSIIEKVRQHYLKLAPDFFDIISCYETEFDSPKEFEHIVKFTQSFFEILENDTSFQQNIIDQLRTR